MMSAVSITPSGWHLRRPQARQLTCPAGNQSQVLHQSQLRQSARPQAAGILLAARRRGDRVAASLLRLLTAASGRLCSLIPGFGVKLSAIILAGPTVLSAVGACPPHDGVRRRWWINVASAVSLMRARKKSGDLTTAIVSAGTSFPARAGTLGSPYGELRGGVPG